MATPLLYYYLSSAYGTRKILFSSSLVPSNTKLMRNHDKDTQLPRALAIPSSSFWRSSLRKGGGQTSCRRSSANMISTTIRSFGPLRIQTANGSMHERKALFHGKIACYSRRPFSCRKDTADEL
jgi:hypothetical protein